jgi:hypothetical protein
MRIRFSLIALTLVMGVLVSSCKKDNTDTKTAEQKKIEQLSKTWAPGSATISELVTVDGTDVTADWPNFVLTLGDKTYNSSGADSPLVWPANGTWAFGSDLNTLIRDDGVEITIKLDDTSLELQFDYNASGGRFDGIEGNWIFKMVPQ